jgi:uncharacterized damage-inducible protein DinB
MSISQSLLPEYDHEMANTRKVLERIPADKLDWKAHAKSNTIGWVGTHLANIPSWTEMTLTRDALDIAPAGGPPYRTKPAESVQAMLESFDKNVAAGRAVLVATRDEEFAKPWSLLSGGATVFTMPRLAVLRTFVLNHIIHHRAHLCVYLRLNDVPVPGLYGPSADEAGM